MEILTHINKRVKLQPQVKLPTEALLAQYGDSTQSQLVHNFTIMYLETALAKYVDCVFQTPQPQAWQSWPCAWLSVRLVQAQEYPLWMSWCSNLMLLFPRMAPAEKSKYVPDMVGSLKGRPVNHQYTLLRMIAPLLGDVQMPTDPKAKESLYGLDKVRLVSACGRTVAPAAAVM
jgi:hypothetical protein